MGFLSGLRTRFMESLRNVFRSEASLDLDLLLDRDAVASLLEAINFERLEKYNAHRRAKPHLAFGVLNVDGGNNLYWDAARTERSLGVQNIQIKHEDMRSLDITAGAVTTVLKDGTHLIFIVNVQAKPQGRGRGVPRPAES